MQCLLAARSRDNGTDARWHGRPSQFVKGIIVQYGDIAERANVDVIDAHRASQRGATPRATSRTCATSSTACAANPSRVPSTLPRIPHHRRRRNDEIAANAIAKPHLRRRFVRDRNPRTLLLTPQQRCDLARFARDGGGERRNSAVYLQNVNDR